MKDLQYLSMCKEVSELYKRNHAQAMPLLRHLLMERAAKVASEQHIEQAVAERLIAPDIAARTGISVDTILGTSIPF